MHLAVLRLSLPKPCHLTRLPFHSAETHSQTERAQDPQTSCQSAQTLHRREDRANEREPESAKPARLPPLAGSTVPLASRPVGSPRSRRSSHGSRRRPPEPPRGV